MTGRGTRHYRVQRHSFCAALRLETPQPCCLRPRPPGPLDRTNGRQRGNTAAMNFVASRPWEKIALDLEKQSRRPVTAVVAFVGQDAPGVMPLAAGDTLVCNASRVAVRAGTTSAKALKAYQRRGVEVFSVDDLHAKVVLGSRWAWVGSANASASSQNALQEASVRVTDTRTLGQIRKWVGQLYSDFDALSRFDVDKLAQIPVRRQPQPTAPRAYAPERLTSDAVHWLVSTESGASTTATRAAERERADVRRDRLRHRRPAALDWIEWVDSRCPIKKDQWLIDVRAGHPRRPARVVKVSRTDQRRFIVWLARVDTPRRPRLAELLAAVGCTRDAWDAVEWAMRVRPQRRQAMLDLYG